MMYLYTVYDELSKRSSSIFEQPNDHMAYRQYRVTLSDLPDIIAADLRLYKLGSYDPNFMKCELLPAPELVDEGTLLSAEGGQS